jgi:uncharacterized repeat protein (TIGR03803 family)
MKRAVIVVLGVCLIVGSHLRAQSSYEAIHTFSGNQGRPTAGLVQGPDGRLYGTTEFGGFHGKGSVYATDASGNAEVLYEFSGANGETPLARLLLASNGDFYGTTSSGGEYGYGTLFRMTPEGSLTTLVNFNGNAQGRFPQAELIEVNELLYGTTVNGGLAISGTVFSLPLDGGELTSYPFDGENGAVPRGPLVYRAADQSLYGTTEAGGEGAGNIFRLTLDGTLEEVVSFDPSTTGANPVDGLVEANDGLYGMAVSGGANGGGTLFRFNPSDGSFDAVHAFSGNDGSTPAGGLQLFADGMLYGTTTNGGSEGFGTVFRFSPVEGTFESLVSFSFFEGGKLPASGVIETPAGVFGTTPNGGPGGLGTLFRLELPSESLGTVASQSSILSFGSSDGASPSGRLLQASDGNFYGTTLSGGEFGLGTVFRLSPDGFVTTVASFDGVNGNSPSGGLLEASNGDLYGTTETGGLGDGSVFRLNPLSGQLTEVAVFDSFAGSGAIPLGGLVEANGSLWGTTDFGPAVFSEDGNSLTFTDGSVFRIPLEGGDITTVVTFTGENGLFPTSGLALHSNGYLYGVTEGGGAFESGTLFRVSTLDDMFEPIKSFNGTDEGWTPAARPFIASDGSIYGTTQMGGSLEQGVVYRVDPSADHAFAAVASFDGNNGSTPTQEGLVQGADGKLYGTTVGGGSGFGVVYQLDGGAIVPVHLFDGIAGSGPNSTLIKSFDDSLYGTTQGPQGGTIFRVTFEDDGVSTLAIAPATATYGGATTLSAVLSSPAGPTAGVEVAFTLNGIAVGSAITSDSGVAELAGVSIAGLDADSYLGAIHASAAAVNVEAAGDLTINRAVPTITIAGGTFVYNTQPQPAIVTVKGINGEDLGPAVVLYNGAAGAPVDPATYVVSASYPGSTNYEDVYATGSVIILPADPGVAGLIAAYGFNEGSGSVAGDASGRKHSGSISGAKHVDEGRFGRALMFDGRSDWVTVAHAADLDLRNALTIEAWVNPTKLSGWNTVVLKETRDSLAYSLYANDDAPRPAGYVNIGGSHKSVAGAGSLPLNTWSHVAVTYSGSMMRLYINGNEVSRRSQTGRLVSSTGPLRIGGNSVWGEYFSGMIDEVRVYGSALSPADIQRDMNTPIAHEFEKPTVSIVSPLDGDVLSGRPMITVAASDNVGISSVQIRVDGDAVQPTLGEAPYMMRLDAANGVHTIRAVARDFAGNQSVSEPITVRISNRRVADYRFNEAGGSTIVDHSGFGNNGVISSSSVTRVSDAQRGTVVQFSGSGRISVPDADSLDLRAAMTLEAWVKPTSSFNWRTVLLKEGNDTLAYGLYSSDDGSKPAGYVRVNGVDRAVRGPKPLSNGEWTHLAMTYDGETMRLFVNGEEKESRPQTGNALVTSGRLSIGGNTVWGEYFRGQMDDVRIYDVAVGEAQIKADMNGVMPE